VAQIVEHGSSVRHPTGVLRRMFDVVRGEARDDAIDIGMFSGSPAARAHSMRAPSPTKRRIVTEGARGRSLTSSA